MLDIQMMNDASEIVHYDRPDIPIYIKHDNLDEYTDKRALCHWHEDIEIIYVTEGGMNYQVNKRTIPLKEKDCILINSRQLHYGFSRPGHGCRFICILFHPKLLSGVRGLYESYVAPFTEQCGPEYLHYGLEHTEAAVIRKAAAEILSLKETKETAYELEILSILCRLWRAVLRLYEPAAVPKDLPDNSSLVLQRKMVSFIYEHYREALTLEEIAASANISRSKCCLIFKQYLQQSPIGYLNKYRLELSRYLLANTSSGVTDIALSCGFNHSSYFSKLFLREYHCTPTEHRKQNQLKADQQLPDAAAYGN